MIPAYQVPGLVVWNRLNAHRAAVFLATHPRNFAVAYLPAYTSELNPEEQSNACVKRAMTNALLDTVDICTASPGASSGTCSTAPN